jgi:hypothetical protein
MKRSVVFGLASSCLLAVPGLAEAQDSDWNRYTLENLGGVFVHIEANEACQAAGVTASAYEADVSLKLIEAEVGVLTQTEMLEHPAMPELRITLDCADGSNGMSGTLAYSVGLRVQQSAQMLRDTQITLPEAVTWFSTDVGVTSAGGAPDSVGASLMAGVEAFAEAWAAVHAEDEGGN